MPRATPNGTEKVGKGVQVSFYSSPVGFYPPVWSLSHRPGSGRGRGSKAGAASGRSQGMGQASLLLTALLVVSVPAFMEHLLYTGCCVKGFDL